ncbi:hypothetical protein FQR65_LT00719 [Abscondita terminalis]|nr:hypothetical protein FQR65_LT00719 [Abscondita terminalis]
MALKIQREIDMKLHEGFHKNVSILTLLYPPCEAFEQVFKQGMFIKNNKTGSQQVIYYLIEILDKPNLKQIIKTWPLHDPRTEYEFRKEVLKYVNEINSFYEDADIPKLTTSHLITPGGSKFIRFMFKLSQFVLFLHIQRNPDIYPNLLLPLKPSKKEFITKENIDKITNAANTINKSTNNLILKFQHAFENALGESDMLQEQLNTVYNDTEELKIKWNSLKERSLVLDDNAAINEELLKVLKTLKCLKKNFQKCQLVCKNLQHPLILEFDKECDVMDGSLYKNQVEHNHLDLINLLKNFNVLATTKYMETKPVKKESLQIEVNRFSKLNGRIELALKENKMIYTEALDLLETLGKESLRNSSVKVLMNSFLIIAFLSHMRTVVNLPQQSVQGNRPFNPTISSFRPTTIAYTDFDTIDNAASQSQSAPTKLPSYGEESFAFRNALSLTQQRPHPRTEAPQSYRRPQEFKRPSPSPNDLEEELLEKELEEPDRLSLLLPQSKFDCIGKSTGYYADEGLGCEVFHYCQDNAKHSWICPESFSFHQVHLICMPAGHDNICTQSTKYHFVNDYLYKPINLEEHQTKPNISLRYSDRFYPDNYNYQQDYEDEEDQTPRYKQPVKPAVPNSRPYKPIENHKRPYPSQFSPTYRPETTIQQVFRSPEEVNISLQQRRPPFVAQRYTNTEEEY